MTSNTAPTLAERLGATSGVDVTDQPTAPGIDACAPLADLLHQVATADRAHLHVVRWLIELQDTAEVEDTTGVPLERWLEQYGRLPRSDRRMYATAATVLASMPATLAAWGRGAISWGQVRVVVLETMRMPKRLWVDVDNLLATESDDFTTADPDDLLALVRRAVWELLPDRANDDEAAAHRDRFLSIQPSLLPGGTGKLYGEGPNHDLVAIADAIDAMVPPPDTSARDRVGDDADPNHESIVTQGRRRWDALVWSLTTAPPNRYRTTTTRCHPVTCSPGPRRPSRST